MKPARQGDVLLVPTTALEGEPIAVRPIAYGEVTGHAHRMVDLPDNYDPELFGGKYGPDVLDTDTDAKRKFDAALMNLPLSQNVTMYVNAKNELTLQVHKPVALVHEEHRTQVVHPGIGKYIPQRQLDPWKEWQRVAD